MTKIVAIRNRGSNSSKSGKIQLGDIVAHTLKTESCPREGIRDSLLTSYFPEFYIHIIVINAYNNYLKAKSNFGKFSQSPRKY